MLNKKLFRPAVIITVFTLSVCGCGKQAEPVSAEPTETVSEVDTEESVESSESIEPTPSPTATPTEKPVEESTENGEEIPSEEVEPEESEPDLGYEIISIDEVTMYATTNCNLRSGAGTQYDKIGSLAYGEEVIINGKVEDAESGKLWYVIKSDDEVKMVSGSLLSTTKPQPQSTGTTGGGSTGGNSTSQQPSSGGTGGGTSGQSGTGATDEQNAILDSIFGGHGNTSGGQIDAGGDHSDGDWGINWQ